MNCTRCKQVLSNTDKKTCDKCMYYVGEIIKCERCNRRYTRTNRERHYRSYRCRVTIFTTTD